MKNITCAGFLFGVLFVSAVSYADVKTDFAYEVLKCYHPADNFVSATFGQEEDRPSGNGVQVIGAINYRGGITGKPYRLVFKAEYKKDDGDSLFRTTLISDTAQYHFDCEYEKWTRKKN
jgi:hypothetical protein